MFQKYVDIYKSKISKMVSGFDTKLIPAYVKSVGIADDNLRNEFESNSPSFKRLAETIASTANKGAIRGYYYAGAVIILAKYLNVPYKAYAGFCVSNDAPLHEKDINAYNERKATQEHPFFANHVYVEACNNTYEYMNKHHENIEHLDVVPLEV